MLVGGLLDAGLASGVDGVGPGVRAGGARNLGLVRAVFVPRDLHLGADAMLRVVTGGRDGHGGACPVGECAGGAVQVVPRLDGDGLLRRLPHRSLAGVAVLRAAPHDDVRVGAVVFAAEVLDRPRLALHLIFRDVEHLGVPPVVLVGGLLDTGLVRGVDGIDLGVSGRHVHRLDLVRAVVVLGHLHLDAAPLGVACDGNLGVDRRPRLVAEVWRLAIQVVPRLGLDGLVDGRLRDHPGRMLGFGGPLDERVVESAVLVARDGLHGVRDALPPVLAGRIGDRRYRVRIPRPVGDDLLRAGHRRADHVPVDVGPVDEILYERVRAVGAGKSVHRLLVVALPRRQRRDVLALNDGPVVDDVPVWSLGEQIAHRLVDARIRNALGEAAYPQGKFLAFAGRAVDAEPLGEDLEPPLPLKRVDPTAGFKLYLVVS